MNSLAKPTKEWPGFMRTLIRVYARDSAYLVIPQVVSAAAVIITLPIILRSLVMEDYGRFQFILAIQLWLTTFTAGQITSGAQRGIAQGKDGTFLFAFFARLKLVLVAGILVLLSSLAIYMFGWETIGKLLAILGIFLIVGYLPNTSIASFFIAKKRFRELAFFGGIMYALIPIVSAFAAVLTHNILVYALAYFGTMSAVGFAGFGYLLLRYHIIAQYRANAIDREGVPYGLKLLPADVVSETSNRISDFIIGPLFGFANLAVFSVARNLEAKARKPTKILHHMLYSDFARRDIDDLVHTIRKRFPFLALLSIVFTIGIASVGVLYISIFLPQSYHGAILYFLILALGLPASLLMILFHTVLAANLRSNELSRLIITSNTLWIVFVLVLGVPFKVVGVTAGMTLGSWVTFILYYLLVMRSPKYKNNDFNNTSHI